MCVNFFKQIFIHLRHIKILFFYLQNIVVVLAYDVYDNVLQKNYALSLFNN